jgi:hypothetical protein
MNQIPEWSYVIVGESLYRNDGNDPDFLEPIEVTQENGNGFNLSKIVSNLFLIISEEFDSMNYFSGIFI